MGTLHEMCVGTVSLLDILMSADGHVIINPAIAPPRYSQEEERLTINASMTLFWVPFSLIKVLDNI